MLAEIRRIFLTATLLLLAHPAFAYLTDSEYQSATEPRHLLLDSQDHWDSEAASDFLTYQRPLEWDGLWLRGSRVFDLAIGSISSKQFLTYQRLKLVQPLSKRLEFRLHWLEVRDFEQDRRALPLELRYRLSDQFSFGLFGQPSLYKSEDDIGVIGTLRPTLQWEIQLAALWPDFQRNQRNLESDSWSSAPRAYTFASTFLPTDSKTGFHRAEAHSEPMSVRSLNGATTRSLNYQMISLSGLHTFGLGSSIGYRLQADRAYDEDHTGASIRSRQRSINQIEYAWYEQAYLLKPGLNFQYREFHSNKESEITRDILPTFWFVFPETAREWGHDSWSLGYDATVFERDSTVQSNQHSIEHRGNVKSTMRFSQAGELALLFTFDLDRFGSGETWEGGAGQFRLDF